MSLSRLKSLQSYIAQNKLDLALISKRENIQYLTSLHQLHPTNREAILFATPKKAILYHSLFLTPPKLKQLECQVMDKNHPLPLVLNQLFPDAPKHPKPPQVIAIEAHDLKVTELEKFKTLLPHSNFKFITDMIEQFRLKKDTSEVDSISKACHITSRTMAWITKELKRLGDRLITEISLARLIENHMYDLSATDLAFPTVVAFNKHSASPHHQVTNTILAPNSVVLLDFGCQVDGYASDMTRTLFIGTPPPRFNQIETVVKNAYSNAIELLSTTFHVKELTESKKLPLTPLSKKKSNKSIKASEVDSAARSVIQTAGFGDQFIHTTGHGLGLEIHEQPSVSSQNYDSLSPGMVITIEPGIYLSGEFGYRHENTVFLY